MVMEMRTSKSSDAISGWKGQLGRGHQSHDGKSRDFVGFNIFYDLTASHDLGNNDNVGMAKSRGFFLRHIMNLKICYTASHDLGNDDNVGMAKSRGFWEIEWGGSAVSLHPDGSYMGDT